MGAVTVTMTKDDFWNPIESRSPKQFEKFKNWVDEYKKRVDWSELWQEGEYIPCIEIKAPKVHELPDALQTGIFIQFITEIEPSYTLSLDFTNMDSVKRGIRDWFEVEEAL